MGEALRVRYASQKKPVIHEASLRIKPGIVTALIGPNGSGKSTLLKVLARQFKPEAGRVILDGREISTLAPRELAQRVGILFQEHSAPGDITVEELVSHGRYPHRRLFEEGTSQDDAAVNEALRLTSLSEIRHRLLGELSGGQRQLAWIAMALAQEPRYLFLDEPTTFLDLVHQFDVMDVVYALNRALGTTVIFVVHDLNLAARYADEIVAMRDGAIMALGAPADVLTSEILLRVFNVEVRVIQDRGELLCVPERRPMQQSPVRLGARPPISGEEEDRHDSDGGRKHAPE